MNHLQVFKAENKAKKTSIFRSRCYRYDGPNKLLSEGTEKGGRLKRCDTTQKDYKQTCQVL